ncbi:aldo/keto reductase [Tabrizicola sp. J26]|uniref:aldo/keto reductase n=1 Tax=Alitabrizicola rongguiensis TaxID=2909234 RepID=UPI001F33B8C7|nr:aldo/keto reductase [Tabrizicola rongguiensis]MCF1709928.1 aldo/keto reductase [Tabrizicola rongguiensis]
MALTTRHWDRIGNGGLTFTTLGFGAAPIGNLYRAISDEAADEILARAWQAGIRYFDTAPLYGMGLSETRLNRFLRSKPREDYVISTKVGRLLRTCAPGEQPDAIGKFFDTPARKEVFDYSYDGVLKSFEISLERLGLDRVDILYAHDLDIYSQGGKDKMDARIEEFMAGGYRALLRLRDEGVIKAFGAGVNEWEPCQMLAERGDFDIFLLAGPYTLLDQTALDSFLPLAQSRGIGVVIGAPYNSGILATGPRPGAFYKYAPAPDWVLERATRIQEICARHNVRMVDAAFQFPLRHPAVVSVIPGGQAVTEVDSNAAAAGAKIPDALWADFRAAGLLHPDAPV